MEPSYCDRVALVIRAEHRQSGVKVAIANSHLTVAHASNSHDIPLCRPQQAAELLAAISADEVLSCI